MVELRELHDGWELAQTAPGELADPGGLDRLSWQPATVPGTVAAAIDPLHADPDESDWWFRTRFDAEPYGPTEQMVLRLDGIATLAEVFLNGQPVLTSRSMFAAHEVDVTGRVRETNELAICCRALAPELRVRRRPRARWRTALAEGNLRFFRTMLLGRAPGFAPGPAVIGPWRPVTLERRTGLVLDVLRLRTRLVDESAGVLSVRLEAHALNAGSAPETVTVRLRGPGGVHESTLALVASDGRLLAEGELRVAPVARWWPHTHGDAVLYDVTLVAGETELHRGRVGFRELAWPPDWESRGLGLRVNGVDIFIRGVVWTPLDMTAPHQPEPVVRAALEQLVSAGMNMVRVPGIACYESDAFHDLCDELGVLVWQDFMLANFDYPAGDREWATEFEAEARYQLGRLACRPSLAVLCGGSEVAQQVAMLGLDPELARGELYTVTLPGLIAEAGAAAVYVPNSPWGGALPFRPDRGVANYYGVGAYLRDLSDARSSAVRFAAECLAFSNVPDEATLARIDAPGGLVPHHPAWKQGVPRDAGAGWDFEDVRDHYLKELYGEDPVALRWTDLQRYLELSRSVTGEVMAEVFGEWRRAQSPCNGALVLWLRDLKPGAGWGIVDQTGRPKVAFHHLRRVLAPIAVWITDEGLGGMIAHVANDRPERLAATLRVALYRDGEVLVEQATVAVDLAPHEVRGLELETIIGRFVDVSFAYRFGPPGHDVVAVSLEHGPEPGEGLLAHAFMFPAGRPATPQAAASLGLEAELAPARDGVATLRLRSRRLVRGLRVDAGQWLPGDDALTLEPGIERRVRLVQTGNAELPEAVVVTALNLMHSVRVNLEGPRTLIG